MARRPGRQHVDMRGLDFKEDEGADIQVQGTRASASLTAMTDGGDMFMIEDISPESWLSREVFARFGLAVYTGQVLEHEIVNLLVWSGIHSGDYTDAGQMEPPTPSCSRKPWAR